MLTNKLTKRHTSLTKAFVFLMIISLMFLNIGQVSFAVGGDFSLDFAAAAPTTYDHDEGGGAWDDGTSNIDTVESLESGDFYSGEHVTFFTQITVDDGAIGSQTIQLDYQFLADTTGSSGAAFTVIDFVGVNSGTVTDLIEGNHEDSGMVGDADAELLGFSFDGTPFSKGALLNCSVEVSGLEAGEVIILRIDAIVEYLYGENPTGNLQASIMEAEVTDSDPELSDGDSTTISVGNQTVPFKIGFVPWPIIHIEKTGAWDDDGDGIYEVGEPLNYDFDVTNAGNIPLSDVTVTDPGVSSITYTGGDANDNNLLDLDETWTYTGVHLLTQADINAGHYYNLATADSEESEPDSDDEDIPIAQLAALQVVKSSTTTVIDHAGQVVPYTFLVTNIGNIALTGITVSDPILDAAAAYVSGDLNDDDKLDLTEIWTYSGQHTVTQGEFDSRGGTDGDLDNTVTADSNESGPDTDDHEIPISRLPMIHVEKTSTTTLIDHAGQIVDYEFSVTNTGNIPLTGVTVSDPNLDAAAAYVSGDSNDDDKLDLTETWIYSGSHTVTQDEIDSNGDGDGDLDNTVTADSNESDPDMDDLAIPIDYDPTLDVQKSSSTTLITEAGQVVPYTFVVTNEGNVTLTGITVTDPILDEAAEYESGDLNDDDKLDLDETWTFNGSHTVTQDEIDSNGGGDGDLDNTVTADSNETDEDTDDHAIPLSLSPEIQVVKSSMTTLIDHAGQVVPYTFTVTNVGNVTLSGITVTDPNLDFIDDATYVSGDTNDDDKLDLDETWIFSGNHTVTQAEIDSNGGGDGDLDNTVTADSNESEPDTDVYDIPIDYDPALNVLKSSTTTSIDHAGQVVPYTFVVTNEGNVTLTGITVSDPNLDSAALYVSGDENDNDKLDIDETWIFSGNHTVTQAEIDGNGGGDGYLDNTVTADSNETEEDTDDHFIEIITGPALEVEKSSETVLITEAGQIVDYTFEVRNIGNMTLTGITVRDPDLDEDAEYEEGDTNGDGKLDLDETWIYSGSHTVTQAEIDSDGGGNGYLDNTVTADSIESDSDTDDHAIPIEQDPGINIVKSSTTTLVTEAGQIIPYTFVVTNTGNMTLTGVTVTDPELDVPAATYVSGDIGLDGKLGLTETWNYIGYHTVTQDEIDSNGGGDGDLDNIATADSNETGPDTDDHAIPLNLSPVIHIEKSSSTSEIFTFGQVVPYTFVVTNLGNVTLTGVTVTDPMLDAAATYVSGDTNEDDKLDLTEIWIFTGYHTVTLAEFNANGGGDGDLDNTATADSNESEPDSDVYDIPIDYNPSITISKLTNGSDGLSIDVGDSITWTYLVTNNGNVPLTNVIVIDDMGTPASDSDDVTVGTIASLAVGASQTLVMNGTATEGLYTNRATVTGTPPTGSDVFAADTSSYTGDEDSEDEPEVELTKSVDKNIAEAPGTFIFTIRIENTGETTFTIAELSDTYANPLPEELQDLIGVELEVGESIERDYTITHETAGTYVNVAFVKVSDVNGNATTDTDSETVTVSGLAVFGAEMPQTGDSSTDRFALFGVLFLMMTGVLLIRWIKKGRT